MSASKQKVLTLTRKDFEWSNFKASGGGGQKRDKTDVGVRCFHPPSGAEGRHSDTRSQSKNRKIAFRKCAESEQFQRWVHLQHAKLAGDVDRAVKDAMRPENLVIETYTP